MSFGILEGFCPASPSGIVESLLCFGAAWEVPLLAGVVLLAVAGVWRRSRSRKDRYEGAPMIVFPLNRDGRSSAPSERRPPPPPRKSSGESRSTGPVASAPGTAPAPSAHSEPPRASSRGPAQPTARTEAAGASSAPSGGAAASPDPSERMVIPSPSGSSRDAVPASGQVPDARRDGTVSYQRPPDGTLQLLPGRLEIERGPGSGEEIRFVRVPGAPAEISFGRDEGPEYRHVRLHSPTVSRSHARMRFNGGSWTLRNESSTNPTTVNGRQLASEIEEARLADGDRIEMGDITFRFRHDEIKDRLPLRSSWYTDHGRRPTNQDAVVVRTLPDDRELAAVGDGMGSHHAGGIASHIALETLVQELSAGANLEAAVERANAAVLESARQDPERDGMGTTLVALLREGDRYHIANVGDSRAYRIGKDGVEQLTLDHSFMAEAMKEGRMSAEEAARSPWRNAVTRNLGADEEVDVDIFPAFNANQEHTVILCTDGVHGVLSEAEIEAVWKETPDVRDLARALSEKALMNGGEDNVAVAAMAFGASTASPAATTGG